MKEANKRKGKQEKKEMSDNKKGALINDDLLGGVKSRVHQAKNLENI